MNSFSTVTINTVHICDMNYLIPTKTLVHSMIKNKHKDDKLRITIIGVGMEPSALDTFFQFRSENVSVDVMVPENRFDDFEIKHVHVSKAALFKFLLPELLPDMDRVLYLDSDMLVTDSLYSLYSVDMKDNYVASVRDFIAEKYQVWHQKLNTNIYFNSGMMLLNLKKMREDKVSEELIRDRRADVSTTFMDQNTLNSVMNGHQICVSPTYNYMLTNNRCDRRELAEFYELSELEMGDIQRRSVVRHYTDRTKPWNSMSAELWKEWFEYLCPEDLDTVLSEIFTNANNQINEIQEENRRLTREKKFIMSQAVEATNYYEKGIVMDEEVFTEDEKKLFENKNEILGSIKKYVENSRIVIYGAGRVGRFIYKILHEAGMQEQVEGFAVSVESGNISSLFGKRIQLLDKFEEKNTLLIWAVKGSIPDNMIEERILDLNRWLYD